VVLTEQPVLNVSHFPTLRGALEPAEHSAPSAITIPGSSLALIEREAILRTVESVGGSTSRAAKILGISPRKIQYKLKDYHADARTPMTRPQSAAS
jgi:two-component system NtrC family response regulator/two-component system response regulator HydG